MCDVFDNNAGHKPDSGLHSSPSFERHYKLVLNAIEEKQVFVNKKKRQHETFKTHKDIFQHINYKGLLQWIKRITLTLAK